MLVLWAVHRDGAEKMLRVQPDEAEVLGRHAPRLILDDSRISRRHARVWYENDAWWLADLDSTHGTKINHDAVTEPTPLHVGDEIRLGRMLLIVREADGHHGDTDAPGPVVGEIEPASTTPDAEPAPDAPDASSAPPLTLTATDDEPVDEAPPPTFRFTDDDPADQTPADSDAPSPYSPQLAGDDAATAQPMPPAPAVAPLPDASHETPDDLDDAPVADPDDDLEDEDVPSRRRPALTGDDQHDAIIQNFGVIFPHSEPAATAHLHARHSQLAHARHNHGRWITWTVFALAGGMIAAAVTVWLMMPG
ncbi:MAG: FHA domain-containing protein [Phycisphaeraceae bacterium]